MSDQDLDLVDDEAISQLFHELGGGGSVLIGSDLSEDDTDLELSESYRTALDAFVLASCPSVEPADSLRGEVMAAVEAEVKPPAPISSFPKLPWMAAACFALLAAVGFIQSVTLQGKVDASDLRIRELASEVDQSFKAFIVWDEERATGVLKVDNLPALGDGGDYQLWVVSEGYEKPLDGGVFDTGEGGRAEMKIVTKELAATPARADKVTLFAISKERPGGVPVSETGQFVLTAAY